MTSVKFFDAEKGFVAGGNKIFQTKTSGNIWKISYTGSELSFFEDLFMIEENKVVAVGLDFGTGESVIVKTEDGGLSWNTISIQNSSFLKSVFFVSPIIGYCSGGGGVILKTTNGGDNWQPLNSGTNQTLNSIYFMDEMNGIAVGGDPISNIILKTIDGGANWTKISTSTSNNLQSVYFANQQIGYIVGWNGEIMKSENGGNTWTNQSSVSMSGNLEVFFTDANTGYIVGGDVNESLIQKTETGGALWEDISPSIDHGLVSIHFTSALNGYAVGASGTVLKTSSGGVSAVQETYSSTQILVYPNPVVDHVSIEASFPEIIESINVFDNNGHTLHSSVIKSSKANLDLFSLEANNYYLVIQTNKGLCIKKFLKV
ncbi:MAG: YCF48-related protein [Saprospiraceae bacterium]